MHDTRVPRIEAFGAALSVSDWGHIIIINFYCAYILRNLSSEVQQNRIIKHNPEHGPTKVIIRMRDNRRFMVEMQFEINSLVFFGR